MTVSDIDQARFGQFVGQLRELLELQKDWGRPFLPWPKKNQGLLGCTRYSSVQFESISDLNQAIVECKKCRLYLNRRQVVPGQGTPNSRLMFIGEGPGFEEDRQGLPFVGPAGQLLTKMIQAIELRREDVYITNVVKCRPPENRVPLEEEVEACRPFIEEEIRLIDPQILVPLGNSAAQALTQTKKKISDLRGHIFDFNGKRLIPSFHPAYLLRNPESKRKAWEDLKKVRRIYDGTDK